MISVCMATYNGEKFIYAQIYSILAQLTDNDELIVSDDDSSDETLNIIKNFNDARIHIFKGPGKGLIKNFENALLQAKGDYIFLADQDDVWMDGKVDMCMKILSDQKKVGMVVTNCLIVDSNLQTIHPSYFVCRNSAPGFLRNIYKGAYHGCCMCFTRTVLDKALPFPNNIPMHDWWIGMVAEVLTHPIFVEQPFLLYRRHGYNVSTASDATTNSLFVILLNRIKLLLNIFKRFVLKR